MKTSWEELKLKIEDLMDEVNASVTVPEEAVGIAMEHIRAVVKEEKLKMIPEKKDHKRPCVRCGSITQVLEPTRVGFTCANCGGSEFRDNNYELGFNAAIDQMLADLERDSKK